MKRMIADGLMGLFSWFAVGALSGIGIIVAREPWSKIPRWGGFFQSAFRIESVGQWGFLAGFALAGLLASFLVVRCILPQDAHLSFRWRVAVWALAIPMTIAIYTAVMMFVWMNGPAPP